MRAMVHPNPRVRMPYSDDPSGGSNLVGRGVGIGIGGSGGGNRRRSVSKHNAPSESRPSPPPPSSVVRGVDLLSNRRRRHASEAVADEGGVEIDPRDDLFSEGRLNLRGGRRRRRPSSDADEGREEYPPAPPTSSTSAWNRLNAALFLGQVLLSAATSVPVALVPTMARSLAGRGEGGATSDEGGGEYAPYYHYSSYGGSDTDALGSGTYGSKATTTTLEVYDKRGKRKGWLPFRVRTAGKKYSYADGTSRGGSGSSSFGDSSSAFVSRLAVLSSLATALGKFVIGPLVDAAGACRLTMICGACVSLALFGLSNATGSGGVVACCAAADFFSSTFWACNTVILGAHARCGRDETEKGGEFGGGDDDDDDDDGGRYERGIYLTSLATRCGSLLAVPISSLLLRWTGLGWRDVAALAALMALGGTAVFYVCVTDSPGKAHDPQNPVRIPNRPPGGRRRCGDRILPFLSALASTVLPSLRAVLSSRVFWAVSLSHTGATVVKSSERVLGTYYRDTSLGSVAEGKAGAMTVVLSVGMLCGLLVGGKAFALASAADASAAGEEKRSGEGGRAETRLASSSKIELEAGRTMRPKNMIAFLYCLSIAACYALSLLALPPVRRFLRLPALVLVLQASAALVLGAGVAVQYYHVPAIVAATFGRDRGLCASYSDGVAALVSSAVWRAVGGAVEEGDPQGRGWAYGWAAVALLLVVCATFMVGIMEVYFVGGGWRHHRRDERWEEEKEGRRGEFPRELPKDPNGSWMEEEIRHAGLRRRRCRGGSSMEDSSLAAAAGLDILSSSALQFISPVRVRRSGESLLNLDESRDEEEEAWECGEGEEITFDLLGIPDNRSIMFPLLESRDDSILSCLPTLQQISGSGSSGGGGGGTLKERVLRLLDSKSNQVCCDCPNQLPRWASILVPVTNASAVGCFCCTDCASAHRNLGTHVAFVRSVDHDDFTEGHVCALERGGNAQVNAAYEATLAADGGGALLPLRPGKGFADGQKRDRFVSSKYAKRLWYHRAELPRGDGSFGGRNRFLTRANAPTIALPKSQDDDDAVSEHSDAIELTTSALIVPLAHHEENRPPRDTGACKDGGIRAEESEEYVSFDRSFGFNRRGSHSSTDLKSIESDERTILLESSTFNDPFSLFAHGNTGKNEAISSSSDEYSRSPSPVDTFTL